MQHPPIWARKMDDISPIGPTTLTLKEWTETFITKPTKNTIMNLKTASQCLSFPCFQMSKMYSMHFYLLPRIESKCFKKSVQNFLLFYYRWRSKYGCMSVSEARRLKALEEETHLLRAANQLRIKTRQSLAPVTKCFGN